MQNKVNFYDFYFALIKKFGLLTTLKYIYDEKPKSAGHLVV